MESSEKELKLRKVDRYRIIDNLNKKDKINISRLLKFNNLSRSGYYRYLKEKEIRDKKDIKDFNLIKAVYDKSKGIYGYRKIAMELNMNHKLANRLLRKNKALNLLNREFKQTTPYRFLSTDITYINYEKGNKWAYLSVIKDIASGEILIYHLSLKMNLNIVFKSLNKLEKYFKENNLNLKNILLHSDQGF